MSELQQTPGLMWELESPPEPFEDDFPMIGQYVLFHDPTRDGAVSLYIPEDDEYRTDPADILDFIMRCAPLASFHGAVGVNIDTTED